MSGLDRAQKIEIIDRLCQQYGQRTDTARLPGLRIVPFVTGRRPTDEVAYPGLGSSDHASLILDQPETWNRTYLLYELNDLTVDGEAFESYAVDISLWFADPEGGQAGRPIPGWQRRPLEPAVLELDADDQPVLRPVSLAELGERRLVVSLCPVETFLPGQGWQWSEISPQLRREATDDQDPFSFGHLFSQQVDVELRLTRSGLPLAHAHTCVMVCDARRAGTLYERVVERLLRRDVARQAEATAAADPGPGYHPWYPVLRIGADKALLNRQALIEDIVHKRSHLTDPLWLLRVSLYLEFLTCIGIAEAVSAEFGDLLTPAERHAYETLPAFAQIRSRIDVPAWRRVWELRHVSFPRFGAPNAGPVSVVNLLQKRKATLAFMEAHHEDLKHAIELAGVNNRNAQETWHRVTRDAERAVLRQTETAFPELTHVNSSIKGFLLWHRQGELDAPGINLIPSQITRLFGDQDGLYAMACGKYRESMNNVARWAKDAGLLDYTGEECVPREASLLLAVMDGRNEQVDRLQRRDGKLERLLDGTSIPELYRPGVSEIADLLGQAAIFQLLTEEEIQSLARNARPIQLGPMERIIVQGRQGSSLFVVADGHLEVLVRQQDGVDLPVAVVDQGAVIGEMSLLTGQERSASVRATDSATVYEIGKMQYEPILRGRPSLVEELACMMEERVRANQAQSADYDARKQVQMISRRIRRFFAF